MRVPMASFDIWHFLLSFPIWAFIRTIINKHWTKSNDRAKNPISCRGLEVKGTIGLFPKGQLWMGVLWVIWPERRNLSDFSILHTFKKKMGQKVSHPYYLVWLLSKYSDLLTYTEFILSSLRDSCNILTMIK